MQSCGKIRREPATRWFDGSFAPMPRFDERFARQHRCGLPPGFPLASSYPGIVHHLSGPHVITLTLTLLGLEVFLTSSHRVSLGPVRPEFCKPPQSFKVLVRSPIPHSRSFPMISDPYSLEVPPGRSVMRLEQSSCSPLTREVTFTLVSRLGFYFSLTLAVT